METFLINEAKVKDLINVTKYVQTSPDLEKQDMHIIASHIAAMQSAYAARMAEMHLASGSKNGWRDDDRLLEIEEAAKRLGVKDDYIYHHSKSLPFIVRLGRKLRFSEKGIDKFIKEQRQISEGV
jgi:excisionase family DNA binding protein